MDLFDSNMTTVDDNNDEVNGGDYSGGDNNDDSDNNIGTGSRRSSINSEEVDQ